MDSEKMIIGKEQKYRPGCSKLESLYISIFGMPIVGLRIRARNIFSLIPQDRDYANILDAGSGTGVFSFELSRRFPLSHVIGTDPLRDQIEACNEIKKIVGISNLEFRQSSILNIEEKDYFDLIICVDILEHIEDDLSALRKLFDLAAPSGIIVLHVPALYRRYPIWKKHLNFDVETHVRTGYKPSDLKNKVEGAGFSIIQSGFTYGFFETLSNNISYMITHAKMKNRGLYSLAFPILSIISILGAKARPKKLGAGVFIVAEKV